MSKRILIAGGVAAGASAAARARRLNEDAEIHVFEAGPYVSFANCGLPYHVGDVIEKESSLILVTPERFKERFDINVHVNNEVVSIDREQRRVQILDTRTHALRWEPYDQLLLATGASAFAPPIPGLDLPGVFTLRTVPETRHVKEWMEAHDAKRAVVVGAGFIGMETAENLRHKGLEVHVVELQEQVIPPVDPEMAAPIQAHMEEHGVHIHVGHGVSQIEHTPAGLVVHTSGGLQLPADLVVLGMGVRPRSALAREAGLAVGPFGGIQVDAQMQTSDPNIWAAGDVIETQNAITGAPTYLPLAGPANRQGRMAADNMDGRGQTFRGVQGTSVCGLFGMTIASTGLSMKVLRKHHPEIKAQAVWLHPGNHVGYYPGKQTIHLKLIYDTDSGRVLGAQAVGNDGVARRIDVISMAIQMKATVYDLEQAELAYSPQHGSAKDAVNMAGMVASNQLRGDMPMVAWLDLEEAQDVLLVDVRERHEFEAGAVPGAINLPLSELRQRAHELPADQEIWLYCFSGKRSYDAVRALMQRGLKVKTVAGGITQWHQDGEPVPSSLTLSSFEAQTEARDLQAAAPQAD